jgi:hypothetical protein
MPRGWALYEKCRIFSPFKQSCSGTFSATLKGSGNLAIHDSTQQSKKGAAMATSRIEEQSVAILEADIIVPSQFFDRIRAERSSQPEKRLMLAVMEDAITTFQKSVHGITRRQRRLLKETEEWIDSSDTSWPFSFENICAALDIEATYLRSGLQQWKGELLAQQRQQTPAPAHSPFRRISGRRHTLSAGRNAPMPRAKAA